MNNWITVNESGPHIVTTGASEFDVKVTMAEKPSVVRNRNRKLRQAKIRRALSPTPLRVS